MWLIHDCEIRETALKSSTDLHGSIPTFAIYSKDTCLINAIDFCDFTSDPCQLFICECGAVGCAEGGYVMFRRLGESLVMLSDFSALSSKDEFERNQYAPPDYLMGDEGKGALFSSAAYATIKSRFPAFPTISKLKPLTSFEAIILIQAQAPLQVLGRFPERPCLDRDLILAVSEGDIDAEAFAVQSFVEECLQRESLLHVVKNNEQCLPIEFHLDGPGFPAWRNFVRFKNQIAISLPPVGILIL